MGEIRVAIAGVGNCCSSLVQGVQFYKNTSEYLGLLHHELGGYRVGDIKFVAAFDIAKSKVGEDLSKAVYSKPNQAPKFVELQKLDTIVKMGPAPDISEEGALNSIVKAEQEPVDIAKELERVKADVLINLISGGSDKATILYADATLKAKCGFINGTPSLIAGEKNFADKFRKAHLPLVGDDLLDQVGATILHIGLLEFLNSRGVHVDESYQLDVGGGTESINTLEKTRDTKRNIKTAAVTASMPYDFPLVSGSTDFVDFLGNGRDSFFWVKGRYYGGSPFTMDVKLSSIDAPNGGSVLIDAIRAMKIARDKGIEGVVESICGYAFKRAKRKNLVEAYRAFREMTG